MFSINSYFSAQKIALHPSINDQRFSCGQLVSEDCDMNDLFTGHKVTPDRMFSIHEKLSENRCKK